MMWAIAPPGEQVMKASAEFVALITQSQQQLHAFICSIIWNPADADDVLQETNLALWEKAEEFDASRPFLPWAMRFAQIQARVYFKKNQRKKINFVIDDELIKLLADEACTENQEFESRRRLLFSCLEKLPPTQRELIAKRYSPSASVNSMAESIGITPKAISDRLRRVRHVLFDCMQRSFAETARE